MRLTRLSSSSSRTTAPFMAPHESDFRAPVAASCSLLWGRCEPPPSPASDGQPDCSLHGWGKQQSQPADTWGLTQDGSVNTTTHSGGAAAVLLHKAVGVSMKPVICDATLLELICPLCLRRFFISSLCRVSVLVASMCRKQKVAVMRYFDWQFPLKQRWKEEEDHKEGEGKWNN